MDARLRKIYGKRGKKIKWKHKITLASIKTRLLIKQAMHTNTIVLISLGKRLHYNTNYIVTLVCNRRLVFIEYIYITGVQTGEIKYIWGYFRVRGYDLCMRSYAIMTLKTTLTNLK